MAERVRIAALADVHCSRTSQGALRPLFARAAERADVLLLAGDLTDYGLPEEARILADELAGVIGAMPTVAVLGNHDHEAGKPEVVQQILTDAGVIVLDGDVCEVHGVGFAGVKGFGGGFGERALQSWGEDSTKRFVHEAVTESLKLEAALARLATGQRVVLLHYAPIRDTVEGESPEIFPFLGSSRLEEPLNRFRVDAVLHGHAHNGRHRGRTSAATDVYNVAVPVLLNAFPDRPPFFLLELSRPGAQRAVR
jgi:Icc-related predicted phosphoesterase